MQLQSSVSAQTDTGILCSLDTLLMFAHDLLHCLTTAEEGSDPVPGV